MQVSEFEVHETILNTRAVRLRDHWLIREDDFASVEEFVLHLIHSKAHEESRALVSGRSVLDWGCNTGWGTEILCETASIVCAIDILAEAVSEARQRLARWNVDVRQCEECRCDFEASRFDVVTMFQVFEHVLDLGALLAEVRRVLRPGGQFILTTPNAAIRLEPGMKPWNPFHVREFRPDELETLLGSVFDHVELFGLHGTKELQEIETNRIARIRGNDRTRKAQSLWSRIRERSERWVRWGTGVSDRGSAGRFSTNDLTYRRDSLDQALDLMAICS